MSRRIAAGITSPKIICSILEPFSQSIDLRVFLNPLPTNLFPIKDVFINSKSFHCCSSAYRQAVLCFAAEGGDYVQFCKPESPCQYAMGL
jgi:hypothetical protein